MLGLQDDLAEARAEVERLRAVHTADVGQLRASLAAANAEVERLRALLSQQRINWTDIVHAAESSLAAANALLVEVVDTASGDPFGIVKRAKAHLAAQPATAPKCQCHLEAGDSECPVHPSCAMCGVKLADGNLCAACSEDG